MADVQTNLRIPIELKEHLQQAANLAGRSLSAEATHRIERAFVLEAQVELVEAHVASQRAQLASMAKEFATLRANLDEVLAENAMLRERARLISETRVADIQAATTFLSEKNDALVARSASAEREAERLLSALKSQELFANTLAQFIVTQASLSTPKAGTERVHQLMRELAENLTKSGGNVAVMDLLRGLAEALKNYVAQRTASIKAGEGAPGLGFKPQAARVKKPESDS